MSLGIHLGETRQCQFDRNLVPILVLARQLNGGFGIEEKAFTGLLVAREPSSVYLD